MDTDKVLTIDMENTYNETSRTAFEYQCDENTQRALNGSYGPLNYAHYYASVVRNFRVIGLLSKFFIYHNFLLIDTRYVH